jgi:hypothetical protein
VDMNDEELVQDIVFQRGSYKDSLKPGSGQE